MRRYAGVVCVALLSMLACRSSKPEVGKGHCDPTLQRCSVTRQLSQITLPVGAEHDRICQTWTLDNPEELLVTTVEMQNDGGYHHSNWFFVPDHMYAVPDGVWSCDKLGFNDLEAGVRGGFLYAQSTQSRHEVQRLPRGAAVRIPPYSRLIGDSHLTNMTGEALTTRMRLMLTTAPRPQVTTLLTPARFSYVDLSLPPRARSEVRAECELAIAHRQLHTSPFRYRLHHVLPHYHELGIYAELALVGGPNDGMVLHRHEGFGTNFGRTFDPPVDIVALGATGLRFTCGYDNPRREVVGWGIHGEEMCVFGLHADTDLAFETKVDRGTSRETHRRKDGTHVFEGPCMIQGFPWDPEKPGGPPR